MLCCEILAKTAPDIRAIATDADGLNFRVPARSTSPTLPNRLATSGVRRTAACPSVASVTPFYAVFSCSIFSVFVLQAWVAWIRVGAGWVLFAYSKLPAILAASDKPIF